MFVSAISCSTLSPSSVAGLSAFAALWLLFAVALTRLCSGLKALTFAWVDVEVCFIVACRRVVFHLWRLIALRCATALHLLNALFCVFQK
jgi:hypothetical protein